MTEQVYTMGYQGYREGPNGERYGKPNMAALPSDIGPAIMEWIRKLPPPDQAAIDRECAKVYERMGKAKENGMY